MWIFYDDLNAMIRLEKQGTRVGLTFDDPYKVDEFSEVYEIWYFDKETNINHLLYKHSIKW